MEYLSEVFPCGLKEVVTFVTTDFFMVLQGFVTELINSKISLFVVIDPIGNCLCAMCNSYAITRD